MGYALSFWAAPVDDLERLLAGHHPPGSPHPPDGGVATPDRADAVAAWLASTDARVGAVDHSMSAGDWFREEVIDGPVAERFGAELADHLLGRPLAGVDWDDRPSVGWVRNAELRAAVTGEDPAGYPETEEGEIVRTITEALARVRDSGQDLVTFYA